MNDEALESDNCCAEDFFSSSSIVFGLDETIQCLMDHPSLWGTENAQGEALLVKGSLKTSNRRGQSVAK